MSSRSSSNPTPRLTRKLYPGSSSPSTTQHYSLRRSATSVISDQNSRIQKVKTKKKNSTSSSISIIRKSFDTATIDDKSSDEEMDENNQLILTNDSDEELNGEFQIQNQPRQRLDSTASNRTEEPKLQKRTTTMKMEDVLGYFTKTNNRLRCNLCVNSRKTFVLNATSDTNLRRHLGGVHDLKEYLYPSQVHNYRPKSKLISNIHKQQLHKAAVEAIYLDGRPLNDFQKPGMTKFLNTAVPGYKGPNRKTVCRQLELLYNTYRINLKQLLSKISDIGVTCDVWKSSSRAYYMGITGHYLDDHHQTKTFVLAFRRFLGSHTKGRLRRFILNEFKKLNIESKIRGITTDNGPDIRAATSNMGVGSRLSCVVHLLNSTIKNGLWLHKNQKIKSKKPIFSNFQKD